MKMVSSGAFLVAISYRLAACFTGISSGITFGVDIYWRSFRHSGNYNYSLRKTVGKKMTKNGPKIDKNCTKIALFLYIFRSCSLKILYWTENRAHDSSESVKRVIPKITSWKSRGARAPVPHTWRRQCKWGRGRSTRGWRSEWGSWFQRWGDA